MNPFPFTCIMADTPIQVPVNGVQCCAYNPMQSGIVQNCCTGKQRILLHGLHKHNPQRYHAGLHALHMEQGIHTRLPQQLANGIQCGLRRQKILPLAAGLTPVSYTHLEVYKRQCSG